jgi:hypothetical protein
MKVFNFGLWLVKRIPLFLTIQESAARADLRYPQQARTQIDARRQATQTRYLPSRTEAPLNFKAVFHGWQRTTSPVERLPAERNDVTTALLVSPLHTGCTIGPKHEHFAQDWGISSYFQTEGLSNSSLQAFRRRSINAPFLSG